MIFSVDSFCVCRVIFNLTSDFFGKNGKFCVLNKICYKNYMKIPKYDMILHVLISLIHKFQEIIFQCKGFKDNYLTYDAIKD